MNRERYDDFRDQGPVVLQKRLGRESAFVLGLAEAKQVLGDQASFVKNPDSTPRIDDRPVEPTADNMWSIMSHNMLNADRPEHTRLRAVVGKALTVRQVNALEPRIQQIADELIDGFIADGSADMIDAFAFPLPIIVISELLGIPVEDRERFREWSHAFIGVTNNPGVSAGSLVEFMVYIGDILAKRRADPRDDLISRLIHTEADGERLAERELYAMIALMIVAGHETTVNLIGNGLLALADEPTQMARLIANPDRIPAAVEEFLRYDGPVEMATMRFAAVDTEVGGVLIKAGTPVTVILGAANLDPSAFSDPHQLDIDREAAAHIAFGYGIHHCVGAPLARMEGRIAFDTLLRRLPGLELAAERTELQYNDSWIVRGLNQLPMRWQRPERSA